MKKFNSLKFIVSAVLVVNGFVASSAFAADYPPSIQKPTFTNPTVTVGTPVDPVEKPTELKNTTTKLTTTIEDPFQVIIKGQKAGAVVTPTLTDSKGKKITLPKIVVSKSGVIDTKAIVIKVPGTYVLAVKLPNGTTKSLTIKVTK